MFFKKNYEYNNVKKSYIKKQVFRYNVILDWIWYGIEKEFGLMLAVDVILFYIIQH